eukprot:jgi/Chlat1/2919/Chrsp2S08904
MLSARPSALAALLSSGRGSGDTAVTTRLPLPMVAVMAPPLTLAQSRPAYALLGRPFTLTLTLQNHTALLQEVAVTVVDAAGFVFVGERSCVVSVLPHETQVVSYRLVAVAAGMLLLPELRVSSLRYNARFQPSNHNRHMHPALFSSKQSPHHSPARWFHQLKMMIGQIGRLVE